MKKLGVSVLAVSSVLLCAPALAAVTTWELRGQVDEFDPGGPDDIDLPLAVGSTFRVLVSFDTNTPFDDPVQSGTGFRYNNFNAQGVSISAYLDGFGPFILTPKSPGILDVIAADSASIIVRDGALFAGTDVDGYSFGVNVRDPTDEVWSSFGVIFRGTNQGLVSSTSLLPLLPPTALTDQASLDILETAVFQVCRDLDPQFSQGCRRGFISGRVTSVTVPTFGTNWFLSARDCQYIDSNTVTGDQSPHDCILEDSPGNRRPGVGRFADNFSGMGIDGFDITYTPVSSNPGPTNGQSLGTVVGKVTFGGPAGLPILRGASLPSDISRTNSNLLAYQRYDYTGAATPLPLVVDLTYSIADNSIDTSIGEVGLRPGGATIGAVIALVDAAKVSVSQVSIANFNAIVCGAEQDLGWPSDSILGSAAFLSPEGENNPAASAILDVRSCADPGQPVQLQADQSFIVASSLQTPSRGKWTLGSTPSANGYVDTRNTMRVTFDPNAPPAVVQNLVDNIVPACDDCAVPEEVSVDVRPGGTGCINPKLNGVIPAAFLGSDRFNAALVVVDNSLKLGSLAPRMHDDQPQCSLQDVNADGYMDLICQFQNTSSNWTPGQTSVALSGTLRNGLSVSGTDTVCVK